MKRVRFTQKTNHNKAERSASGTRLQDGFNLGRMFSNRNRDQAHPAVAQPRYYPPLNNRVAKHHLPHARHIATKRKINDVLNVGPQRQAT